MTQLIADLAIHGWDLARATWQEDTIDVDAVALLLPWAEANADLLTGSGMFGARVNFAPDDPEDARLLGPGWSPPRESGHDIVPYRRRWAEHLAGNTRNGGNQR